MEAIVPWFSTPGFAGAAAVVAAVIAGGIGWSTARQERAQRDRAERKAQWWLRAQWALDLTFSADTEVRTTGFKVLQALGESDWAEEHEFDVIAAATDRSLKQDEVSTPARWYRRMLLRRSS